MSKRKAAKPAGEILGRIPREQYNAIDAVNYSTLKEMAKSPAHYRFLVANPQEPTDAMLLGSATHTSILEPRQFMLQYVIQPETRTNDKGVEVKWVRNGTHWDSFVAANPGKTILTKAQYDEAWDMQEAVRKHKKASEWLAAGKMFECAVRWTDPATGVACKAIIDILGDDAITDLKTAIDTTERAFQGAAVRLRYHWQASFYQDAILAITGKLLPFRYIAAPKAPPIDAGTICYEPDEQFMQAGRDQYRDALWKLVECRQSGNWPGIAEEPQTLTLPAWAVEEDSSDDLAAFNQEL